ncbi:hypothetical protein AX17_004570 [Amanita inopinata Kibby_2008]|nr:hypothetical protein AX17_004570 [Amanita inopinata Kibby_2008]
MAGDLSNCRSGWNIINRTGIVRNFSSSSTTTNSEILDMSSMDPELESDHATNALTLLGEHLIHSILTGQSFEEIKNIIDSGAPVWYQNENESISPLHAAAYVQDPTLVGYLIEQGAVWNLVDKMNHTAGDIALSFNDAELYTLIRDAGIRSELLLSLLSNQESTSSTIVLRETDGTPAGSSKAFLSSKLHFTKDETGQDVCLVNAGSQEVGVMMGWEREIMRETVQRLCQNHKNAQHLRVLNVGFGLGIIDGFLQALPTPPALHVIIEPHPDVLQYMRTLGYYNRPGVRILEGKWQDFIDKEEILGVGGFDVVYTDTFSESYSDLLKFFESLPDLLSGPESRFSFFNGLGATNLLFYDVYTHIAELHLADIGLDVQWFDVDVIRDAEEDREDGDQASSTPSYGPTASYMEFMVPPPPRVPGSSSYDKRADFFPFKGSPLVQGLLTMTIYSLYIYDRHCTCVYYQDWHRTKRPKLAVEGRLLSAVAKAVAPVQSNTDTNPSLPAYGSPRNTLSSSTGVVVAMNEMTLQPPGTPSAQPNANAQPASGSGLPFDEEAKLVYGVVLSLKNMIKKLSGRDEQFVNYKTSTYRLHLYETLSGYKFVMLSDPDTESLRPALRQIYAGPFVDYVVRNPLTTMDSRTHGIDNEYFRASLDRYIRGLLAFS